MDNLKRIDIWASSQEEEDRMFRGHFHYWQAMISAMQEKDLAYKTVLDFGCNQGGFLRMLYNHRPFLKGVGVDIATDSLNLATRLSHGLPVAYKHVSELPQQKNMFDVAFSHEVIFLLSDIDAHACQMRDWLKPGGAYYVVTGCHTNNPLWADWKKKAATSTVPTKDYSLDDYANAFSRNGFHVALKPLALDGFIETEADDSVYFPNLLDKLKYHTQHKIIFRFTSLESGT